MVTVVSVDPLLGIGLCPASNWSHMREIWLYESSSNKSVVSFCTEALVCGVLGCNINPGGGCKKELGISLNKLSLYIVLLEGTLVYMVTGILLVLHSTCRFVEVALFHLYCIGSPILTI